MYSELMNSLSDENINQQSPQHNLELFWKDFLKSRAFAQPDFKFDRSQDNA